MRMIRKSVLFFAVLPYLMMVGGVSSNMLVEWANDGRFPVQVSHVKLALFNPNAEGMFDGVHCVMTSETHLNILADVFDFGDTGIVSIGDILIQYGSEWKNYCLLIAICIVLFKRPNDNY